MSCRRQKVTLRGFEELSMKLSMFEPWFFAEVPIAEQIEESSINKQPRKQVCLTRKLKYFSSPFYSLLDIFNS